MGVKNLWDILESCKKTLPLNHLQNKRVCIDLSCWVVQLQNVNKAHCAMSDKLYLKGLFHRLRALIALNCSLIFVTDGSIPAIKLATYRQRLNSGSEAGHEEENSQKAQPLRRNKGSEFSRMVKEAKTLGLAMGIPCLDGIEEAEAQCALLNSESLCDGCFTSDSDVFLFGARTVYREICLGEGGHVVCYEMADIEDKLGFGRKSLITLALLLGCDYSQGVHGLGPESACHFVKSVGNDNVLELITSDGFSFTKKKCAKGQTQSLPSDNVTRFMDTRMDTNGKCTNVQRQHQFLRVIDAYLRPKCHSADSDAVYKVLAQHPFQRAELHQICASFFEWPPEKTDGYILPKVAERELRRYANLRSASSKLGHMPHISQIPAKCPVSEIVKQRKVQGRECFEVLWEGLDGLETCVVPADLIESACPEKIAEFHEKRAVAKKPNHRKPRPKKTETASTVAEIHLDLHSLLLDIESGSDTTSDAFLANTHSSQGSMAAEVEFESNDGFNDDECSLTAEVEFESNGTVNARLGSRNTCNSATYIDDRGPCIATNEVIDLLSPSPPARHHKVSRCEQDNCKEVDVIDLSDSDTENVSPKHARKARELRMFLAEIKGDLN